MIRVEGVSHHYGVRPVLTDVNLTVARGEILAILGPNGMGKSTLMGIIGGLTMPLEGRVVIDGVERRGTVEGEREVRRKVAYLPTTPWLPEGMSGREWLLAVAEIYGVEAKRAFAHIEGLLEIFELGKQADARVSSYSTGQKKKLAVAGALVTEAPVMVLDEPFSGGLDPSALRALKRVLMALIARDDRTVVMAAPVPEIVEELLDATGRVAVLVEGRIVACETMAGLRAKYGQGEGETLEVIYERIASPASVSSVGSYLSKFT